MKEMEVKYFEISRFINEKEQTISDDSEILKSKLDFMEREIMLNIKNLSLSKPDSLKSSKSLDISFTSHDLAIKRLE
jgi:hypothetical protein